MASDGLAILIASPLNWLARKLGLQADDFDPEDLHRGKEVVVVSCDDQHIRVECDGTTWNAILVDTQTSVKVGQRLKVLGANGLTLKVTYEGL